ncbi:MAG: phosphohistidine phosphatase SixA [Burkholderiales bacterium]|nr:phosphohistidine phosphatase SixA [Burkholderiales bacterium]
MDLILWRHAEAEEGVPDLARRLTAKGHKQAARVAGWLAQHLPKDARVLVSPAVRAQETAVALTTAFETVQAIAPGAHALALIDAVEWPRAKHTVLVVGHQPTLGEAAGMLVTGTHQEWPLKKGAILWLTYRTRGHAGEVVIRAALSPELA